MSRADSPLRDRVIFLVGARRSGTNWLQRIVAAHPSVACAPTETYLFSRGVALLADRFQHGAAGSYTLAKIYMDRDAFLDAMRDFCDQVFIGLRDVLDPKAERVAERTPEHSEHLDLIGDIYPDARVAHIIRDGRDVARSLASQSWGPESIADAATEWRTSVTRARAAGARLDHYYEVRYEELLADPVTQVPMLFAALDLDASEHIVRDVLVEAEVPYNTDRNMPSVAAGKWRDVFSPADLAAFEQVAGDLRADLGYEAGTASAATAAPSPDAAVAAAAAPSVVSRGTTLVRRVVGKARRLRADARDPLALGQIQEMMDQFLSLAATGRWDDVTELIDPTALCRVVSADGDWQGRGASGRDKFIAALQADPAFRGRQVRGDVWPAFPQYTFVGSYSVDGKTFDRILLLTADGGKANRVTWYQLPLRHSPAASS
jgi:sulfotransferase family protein